VIAESADDVAGARRSAKTLAVFDRSTGALTAVRPGTVTITVASGGLEQTATVKLAR
jgi:uncharacterized protein YjdB